VNIFVLLFLGFLQRDDRKRKACFGLECQPAEISLFHVCKNAYVTTPQKKKPQFWSRQRDANTKKRRRRMFPIFTKKLYEKTRKIPKQQRKNCTTNNNKKVM